MIPSYVELKAWFQLSRVAVGLVCLLGAAAVQSAELSGREAGRSNPILPD